MKTNKRTLPMQMLRAAVEPSTFNEAARTVDLVWATGAKGLRSFWGEKYYEELSMQPEHVDLTRLNDGSHPLLAVHNDQSLDSVIGVIESASVDGKRGVARVRFAKDDISERAFQKVKDGILRNISVGYSIDKVEEYKNADEEFPTIRAVRWQPAEISLVPIGFDAAAKVRNKEQITENEVEIITRSVETKQEKSEMTVKKEDLASTQVDTEALKKEAAEQERKRSAGIRSQVREAKLDETFADELIERGLSEDESKKQIELITRALKKSEETRVNATVRVEVGQTDTEKKREAISEALLTRIDSSFKLSQGNPFAGYSMLRMMEAIVGRRPGQTDANFARSAMSSSDLPYILSNVAEKGVQKKYELQPRTWERWAKKDTLRNYKTADKMRSGDFADLQKRQESGEFKRGSFGEEREQVTLEDYGIILPFTRRMLINDDLGEISKVIAQSGVAASRLENRLVYAQLTGNPTMGDGVALFYATHANLGSAAALSDTTIGEAVKLMKKQSSVDGLDKLNLSPKYLICGPDNETLARKYLSQIQPTQSSNVNIFANSMELIVDAEITNDDYFFAADQNVIETVTLFHLEGEEKPRVESRINFENEEVEVKVAHAAVAKPMDWRGLVKNAGAT